MLTAPHRFTDYATGRVIATEFFRLDSPDMLEEVMRRAEDLARIEGVTIDCLSALTMPSGKVASWDRMGVKVSP